MSREITILINQTTEDGATCVKVEFNEKNVGVLQPEERRVSEALGVALKDALIREGRKYTMGATILEIGGPA